MNKNQIDSKKSIEKTLIESIKNRENVTKERLEQAEAINFKAIPEKVIPTDEFGFIKRRQSSSNRPRSSKKRIT